MKKFIRTVEISLNSSLRSRPKCNVSRQRGLSLVEVFVALLVLSVGLIALAKLQVDLVRGGGDARARATALAIAEGKIEDLRTYAVVQAPDGLSWTTTVTPMAWSFIGNNSGGRIPAGSVERAGVRYALSWTATEKTVPGSNGNEGRFKQANVAVTWTGPNGVSEEVTLVANISAAIPAMVKLAGSPPTTAGGPSIIHKEWPRPEVIWTDVGGGTRRETSRPLPTVSAKRDSTLVSFDVVNYRADTKAVERREEFLTVSCKCTFAASSNVLGRTPAQVILMGGRLGDLSGKWVSKPTGVMRDKVAQPDVCAVCCRDHHDYTDGTTHYRYNPEATADHQHYELKSDGTLNGPVTTGNYDEACRLKRINGVWQVFEDWQLRTLTVMPKSDLLDDAKAAEYQTAVQNFVSSYAAAKAGSGTVPTSLSFTPSAVSLDPNAKQLVARAIYIDHMPSDLLAKIGAAVSAGNGASVLPLVPFYEVHLTKLADWISRDTEKTKAKVTSNNIPDQNNVVDDGTLDGAGSVYSRGLAQPQTNSTSGNTTIIATARRYNTGLTNTSPINTTEDDGHVISQTVTPGPYYYTTTDPESTPPAEHRDGSIAVSVGGGISISGSFQPAVGTPKSPQANKISPPVGSNGATCSSTAAGGTIGEGYSCTVPMNWTGQITFVSTAGYSFCLNPGSAGSPCSALPGGVWTISTPVTTSISQDIYVWRP